MINVKSAVLDLAFDYFNLIQLMLPIILRKKRTHKNRLNNLWQTLKRMRCDVEQLESEMSVIRTRFIDEVLPREKSVLLPPRVALIERLIEFMSRKSLADWHRQELASWVSLELDAVALIDSALSLSLSDKYNRVVHALYPDVDEDAFSDEPFDATHSAFDSEQAAYEQILQQLESGVSEEDFLDLMNALLGEMSAEEIDAQDYDDFQNKNSIDVHSHESEDITSSRWLRDLFRRVTKKIHPDKEQHNDLKLEKEKIMAQLLVARDSGDIATMLEIISDHLSAEELDGFAINFEQIEQTLANQIDHFKELKTQLVYHSDLSTYLYQSFYAKSKHECQQKFEDYLENIDDVAERIKEMLEYLKNLTCLKEVLQLRNKRNNLLYADDLFGGFGSKDVDGLF